MRYYIAFALAVLSLCSGYCQSKRVLGDFAYKDKVYSYEFAQEDSDIFSLQISRSLTQLSTGVAPKPDSLATSSTSVKKVFDKFIKEEFVKVFVSQMQNLYAEKDTSSLKETGAEIFFRVKAKRDFVDDTPVTAYLILKRDTIYSFPASSGLNGYKGELISAKLTHKILNIQVITDEGTIKDISVKAVKNREGLTTTSRDFITFKNLYPISISGKFDQDKLSDLYLYCLECGGIPSLSRYLKLGDLLTLDIVYQPDKDDFSPAKGKYNLSPNNPVSELTKERRSKIFEAAAFSDVEGLRNEKPNGLVQIEVKRRLNLWNKHFPLSKETKSRQAAALYDYEPYLILEAPTSSSAQIINVDTKSDVKENTITVERFESPKSTSEKSGNRLSESNRVSLVEYKLRKRHGFAYYNLFGGLELKLLFAKLEEKNRFLVANQVEGHTMIRPIDWYRYQLINLGGTLNVLRLAFPQTKLTWNVLQVGAFWQTNSLIRSVDFVSDTLRNVSSALYQVNTGLLFRPDSRWGANLGIDYLRPRIWEPQVVLSNRGGLIRFYLDVSVKTNDNSQFFARGRITREITRDARDFVQLQLGYQFDIFKGTKDPRPLEP